MDKMKTEWVNILFSFVKYRDTVSTHQTNKGVVKENGSESDLTLIQ